MSAKARLRSCLAAAFLLVGLCAAGAGSFHRDALKIIPLRDVIRFATARYAAIQFVDEAADRAERLDEIAVLDPEVRTLVWLSVLASGLTEQTEANGNAPSAYVGTGRWDGSIRKALVDADLSRQAEAFTTATAARASPKDGGAIDSIDLGRSFDTKSAFVSAIEAYAREHPRVTAWCETSRARLSDEDRLSALLDALAGRNASDDQLMSWPEPFRALVLAGVFESEVGNGGMNQFFSNSSGDLAPETVEALRVVGLPHYADIVARGMGFFGKPYPKSRARRTTAFDGNDPANLEERLAALTETVDYDAVRPAMVVFARQRDLLPR